MTNPDTATHLRTLLTQCNRLRGGFDQLSRKPLDRFGNKFIKRNVNSKLIATEPSDHKIRKVRLRQGIKTLSDFT
ncbi:Uncharacterised protein [Vibrio cholerae]|nr:Uncharacterised protein [Vibrio cholerae]CSB79877.1 Uncharacterised protein [Vibrio cholerae]